ncbi:Multidrug resistance protein MdtA precursor [Pseudovibrio sp. W64]|uniref:efflux RND transporter periplasmic adaptor subunit n=1 Tax=unclassified Pseudovibrio TaxID=2627060 RepID=UPI0007AE62A8|nr:MULTISPECIES: efflux RND transporter periplasmic adaptor subunit [unclassified Pseudovibrio]KZK81944.1 Multidrug resistance protein MdtA precursor [Pseudovibrio sp. W64]KZK92465.1 Multidrug resistance protein MdtA precursor [Pseudovibrio sp. W74]KZL08640.1 Multidrug resistance protein MdtA precursor [Pseudovibrio sp. Ad14]
MSRSRQAVKVGLIAVVVGVAGLYIGKPALFSKPVPLLSSVGLTLWPVETADVAVKGSDNKQQGKRGSGKRGGGSQEILARARNVTTGVTDTFVRAIGTGRAAKMTDLYPESSGRIQELPFKAGTRVSTGDVVLRLDDAEEKLAVNRAKLALKDAEEQVERYEKLMSSQTISTVQMQNALLATNQARLDLDKASIDLDRRLVRAPFEGILGIMDVEIGDYVTQSSRITGLDDRSSILVEFVVPERFANKVKRGDTVELRTEAMPGHTFSGELTALENRVNSESRTLKVQATVANPDDLLRSGIAFDARVQLEGDEWPSVPSIALKWDRSGPHVWLAENGEALRTDVTVIERSADRVLIEGEVEPGDIVITESVRDLRPGTKVTLQAEPGFTLTKPEGVNAPLVSETQTSDENVGAQRKGKGNGQGKNKPDTGQTDKSEPVKSSGSQSGISADSTTKSSS